ncbi:MAG: YlbF family regulator [Paenibacillaceae bacterium]|nr:YlbF family regulator [Paenibacillaceae bacterium]
MMKPVQTIDRPTVLDFVDVWELSNRLAHALLVSTEVEKYVTARAQLDIDDRAMRWQRTLQDAQMLYEEAQRFGHFHPNYHEALSRVDDIVRQGDCIDAVSAWKHAEQTLADLLYDVGRTIAGAVSPSIKVPYDGLDAASCGTGGCSSGGCGGSCGCG